jgi:hypothetical protein
MPANHRAPAAPAPTMNPLAMHEALWAEKRRYVLGSSEPAVDSDNAASRDPRVFTIDDLRARLSQPRATPGTSEDVE